MLADLVDGRRGATKVGVASPAHLAPVRRDDRRAGRGRPPRRRRRRPSTLLERGRRARRARRGRRLRSPASARWSRRTRSSRAARGRGRRRRAGAASCSTAAPAVRAPRGALRRAPLEPRRSSAGWARRPASRSGRPGTPAGRCSSPPTTTGSASTTVTSGSWCGRGGDDARALRAAIDGSAGRLDLATSRLAQVETMHALTIHKSQGSQADEVDRDPAAARVTAADPRALLHRDHPRQGARRGGRLAAATCARPSSAAPCARPGCSSASRPPTEPRNLRVMPVT